MLREMADLGFTHAELSHGIRITLVPGILKAVEEGVIKIGTTHNFCPLPTGVSQAAPNLFEPSARDHREHDQWLRYTKRSIDFAAQVKARVLVCHLGSVEFLWFNPEGKLEAYIESHPGLVAGEDPVYQEAAGQEPGQNAQAHGAVLGADAAECAGSPRLREQPRACSWASRTARPSPSCRWTTITRTSSPVYRRMPRWATGTTPGTPTSRKRWAC
jgi:sugar phosphate isomerase/epimerase